MSDKKQIMIEIDGSSVKVGMTKNISPMDALEYLNDASHTIMQGIRKQAEEMKDKIKENKIIMPNMQEVIKANKAKVH